MLKESRDIEHAERILDSGMRTPMVSRFVTAHRKNHTGTETSVATLARQRCVQRGGKERPCTIRGSENVEGTQPVH
jgi:hypothetical protein